MGLCAPDRSDFGQFAERMVLFVDVLRRSGFTDLQNGIVRVVSLVLSGVNRVFYSNRAIPADKP